MRHNNIVTVYTEITSVGNTSITMNIDVEVRSKTTNKEFSVTDAEFTFVAIDENFTPIPVRDVLHAHIEDEEFNKMVG